MGSGSSKKTAATTKKQPTSAKSASSSTSSESAKSGTAASVGASSGKPAETTGTQQPIKNEDTSGRSSVVSSGTASQSQETKTTEPSTKLGEIKATEHIVHCNRLDLM